jgi:hypothetical protein
MSEEYYANYYLNNNSGPLRKYFLNELDETSPKYLGNINSKILLKEHQLTLLNKCIELELNPFINITDESILNVSTDIQTQYGIIADKTGSGKSYVILSMILLNKSLIKDFRALRNIGNYINYNRKEEFNECPCNIIIIPHNIKQQWTAYVDKFCIPTNTLNYFLIDSNKTLLKCVDDWETVYKFYHIIFVTGSFYRQLEEFINLHRFKVSRIIFDEADTCRIPCCRKIRAHFYWFITASYKNIVFPYRYGIWNRITRNRDILTNGIENNKFIKEIFKSNLSYSNDDINKKILDGLIIKNIDSYVDASFNLPEINYNTIICKEPVYLHLLTGIVSNNILQYLHAGDIKGAIDCVNKKNVNTEDNIINKILNDYRTKIYNIECKINTVNIMSFDNEQEKLEKLTKLQSEKKTISDKLHLLEERLRKDSNNCIICYDNIQNKTITKCCNNSFCLECITEWFKRNAVCPLCKNRIDFDSLYYINEDFMNICENEIIIDDNQYKYESFTKYENLIYILENSSRNAKFLICSDYDNTFIELEDKLRKKNIEYDKIKGNSICNTINRYKNNSLKVLLVNSKYYGSGMNLENTTDIILFHKLESEIEKQVIGRAQRMGRTTPLNIWYLLHKSELN